MMEGEGGAVGEGQGWREKRETGGGRKTGGESRKVAGEEIVEIRGVEGKKLIRAEG